MHAISLLINCVQARPGRLRKSPLRRQQLLYLTQSELGTRQLHVCAPRQQLQSLLLCP